MASRLRSAMNIDIDLAVIYGATGSRVAADANRLLVAMGQWWRHRDSCTHGPGYARNCDVCALVLLALTQAISSFGS
jgi:hypothetical protein